MSHKTKIVLVVLLGAVVTFTAWRNHQKKAERLKSEIGKSDAQAVVILFPETPPPNSTPAKEGISYTVTVGSIHAPLWVETNCVEIVQHTPECKLITFADSQGKLTEVHAWMVDVVVSTNR